MLGRFLLCSRQLCLVNLFIFRFFVNVSLSLVKEGRIFLVLPRYFVESKVAEGANDSLLELLHLNFTLSISLLLEFDAPQLGNCFLSLFLIQLKLSSPRMHLHLGSSSAQLWDSLYTWQAKQEKNFIIIKIIPKNKFHFSKQRSSQWTKFIQVKKVQFSKQRSSH